MAPITGKTQVLGIIGHPIAHSLSPLMQNAVLAELDIDAVFVPFAVAPNNLPAAVVGLKALGVIGFNVTVPHKEAILPLLDEVDEAATRIGAVNTVKLAGDRLVGSNTDAPGFLASVREDLNFNPTAADVVVIGAGGAARASLAALAGAGVRSILIANRTVRRAKELCDEFKVYFPQVDISSSDLAVLGDAARLASSGLLVNTSSVGLNGTAFADLDLHGLSQLKVYDMVYGVEPTPLVQAARAAGCMAVNGHGMLAAQGELAFTTWLGAVPPTGLMKSILLRVCNQVTLDNH